MALEPLVLDDLKWKDLVDAARRRIPAASRGKWTLHAPVDPGITILELTAWLLEQRLYWLDRVTDPFGHALGALLGERCRSARAATTVFWIDPDEITKPTLVLPEETALELRASDTRLTFTLDHDLTALPARRVRVIYDRRDRTDDLEQHRPLDLTGSTMREVHFVIELDVDASYAHPAIALAAPIALFLELETPQGMPLEWSSLDGPTPELAPLPVQWSYRSATSDHQPFSPGAVRDGTLGLRRSGIVRLMPGADWVQDPSAPTYTFTVRFDPGAFPAAPRLQSVAPNAAVARNRDAHRECRSILDWVPLPDRSIQLANDDAALPIETTVKLWLEEQSEVGSEWHEWKPVDDFAQSTASDRVFVVERTRGLIRFGNGIGGRVPVLTHPANGTGNAVVMFDTGGGEQGNVSADLEWDGSSGAAGIQATNILPGHGGRSSESIAQLHERIAAELEQPTRAVVTDDFASLLRSAGLGLRRVHTAVGHHPAFPATTVPGTMTVFIVPDVPRAPARDDAGVEGAFVAAPRPDAAVLATARKHLESARLASSELFVCPPRYRRVNLAVHVTSASHSPERLRERIRRRLVWFLDPLAGGDEQTGWPFGGPIQPSALLREAQDAVGRDGRVHGVDIGLDGACPEPACDDVAIRSYELVVADTVTVSIDRPVPSANDTRGFQ